MGIALNRLNADMRPFVKAIRIMKTRKSIKKRFKITKTGKVLKRTVGQSHFNAKKTGKQRRKSRKWVKISNVDAKKIKKLLR